jgi:hypothetical protein
MRLLLTWMCKVLKVMKMEGSPPPPLIAGATAIDKDGGD